MSIKRKILAGIGTAVLLSGLIVGSAAPANAVYGNRLVNSVNRCTDYVPDGWAATRTIRMCGAAAQASNVHYVRIQPGQCVGLGYWSFTYYCATGSPRNIAIGGGVTFVR